MEEIINLKKKQLNNLMNEIDQKLELLDYEDFIIAVEDYNKVKNGYYKTLSDITTTPLTTIILSLDTTYGALMEFNDRICSIYNLQTGVLRAA